MDDDRGEGWGNGLIWGTGQQTTSSGVERREVEFLATLPPLSGLFFFFHYYRKLFLFFFFNREYK